jgi:cation transport ATPase
VAVKAEIQGQIDESAESDEEVVEAREKQAKQKLAAKNLKEAMEVFTKTEEDFATAEKNLKKNSEDAELKAQHSEAKSNFAMARKEKLAAERESKKAGEEPSIGDIISGLALMLFTTNLFDSAAKTNLLPLIVFSIVFAGMLTTLGDRVFAITRMVGQINEALMFFIMLLMKIAPLGIMCLVAAPGGQSCGRRRSRRDARPAKPLSRHCHRRSCRAHLCHPVFSLLVFHA